MTEIDKKAAEYGIDMSVELAGIRLKNPVCTASGTFSARESGRFYDISELGAAVTKGVAAEPWPGNDTPRIAETYGGMLNSVGLQNPGAAAYREAELPFLSRFDTKIITNIAGHSIDEYCEAVRMLNDCPEISMFEINISCPNVSGGGIAFGTDPAMAARVTEEVKKISKKPVMIKLTPNVTDIVEIARAVEAGGADAVSLINTLLGMRIDLKKRKAVLARKVGGFSGPAVKPVALRMVWEVHQAVDVPLLGMGGISCATDAVEFMLAGATAVAVGTANFVNPHATVEIIDGIAQYCKRHGVEDVQELIGALEW